MIAKCESPSISDGSGLNILGYRDLALEGTNITLICTSGFQFNDPIIARCASTGKWIPDPNEMIVKCLGIHTESHMHHKFAKYWRW